MDLNDLAKQWRDNRPDLRGGVVVIFNGKVDGWVHKLRDPDHWVPGCIAVDESGAQWISVGGDDYNGAERWEPA